MIYNKNLLKEFSEGAMEISAEIIKLLDELPANSGSELGSPLLKIHKYIKNLIKSSEFIWLENTAKFLKQADNIIVAIKDNRIEVNETLVKSVKELFIKFEEIIKKEDFEESKAIFTLKQAAQNVEKGLLIDVKILPEAKETVIINDGIDKIPVSDDDMLQNFISDSNEQLNIAEEAFLLLKERGFDLEIMNSAYRQIHSFKGNCGFMQFDDLMQISHTMENIMQFMRDKKLEINKKSVSFMLKYIDVLRNGIAAIEQNGDSSIPETEEYIKKAINLFPECFIGSNIPAKAVKEMQVLKQDEVVAKNLTQIPNSNAHNIKRQDFRVDLEKLEKIINLTDELVIAENKVSKNPEILKISNKSLNRSISNLQKICNSLQDATMSLCMVQLNGLFKKMTRLVYDLSNHIGKKINLVTVGENTEVDKSIFELINDPLVHIIRNACDHGIETPAERIAAGKNETGTITISGENKNGAVWISVKDDGYGFNKEKIIKKAIEQKLISNKSKLTNEEIAKLVLRPGFSTAEIVSDISGRGVGMDVVQKNIENIGGEIAIKSKEGKGTEFIIKIPFKRIGKYRKEKV